MYDPQSHTMACQGLFYLSISDELSKNSEQGKKISYNNNLACTCASEQFQEPEHKQFV